MQTFAAKAVEQVTLLTVAVLHLSPATLVDLQPYVSEHLPRREIRDLKSRKADQCLRKRLDRVITGQLFHDHALFSR